MVWITLDYPNCPFLSQLWLAKSQRFPTFPASMVKNSHAKRLNEGGDLRNPCDGAGNVQDTGSLRHSWYRGMPGLSKSLMWSIYKYTHTHIYIYIMLYIYNAIYIMQFKSVQYICTSSRKKNIASPLQALPRIKSTLDEGNVNRAGRPVR